MHTKAHEALAIVTVALALSGCMSFEVGSNASMTEESKVGSETVSGSLYGFSWGEYHVQKCNDSALALVEFTYTGWQFAASALSLGLYVSQTVEWWCDDPAVKDDTEDGDDLNPRGESARAAGHVESNMS